MVKKGEKRSSLPLGGRRKRCGRESIRHWPWAERKGFAAKRVKKGKQTTKDGSSIGVGHRERLRAGGRKGKKRYPDLESGARAKRLKRNRGGDG